MPNNTRGLLKKSLQQSCDNIDRAIEDLAQVGNATFLVHPEITDNMTKITVALVMCQDMIKAQRDEI